ncbi:outer membrane beta-barrel family protein [Chryseobacterium ginsenosidimutans]
MSKDSTIIKNELSDEKGLFSINTENGAYILQIKRLKDIVYTKNIEINKNVDLGNITIENIQDIKEVVLNSRKKLIERKVDRLVFNVENSISATGGDATDALRNTPNIRVQNEQISMIGKNGMSLMIDDRMVQLSGEELINFLRTIKSDDIKSIEVITNPPAKYDAEGNSGIVNIKLKKAEKNSISGNLKSSYTQATYALGNIGGGLNYQKGKLTVTSNINYSNGSFAPYQEYTLSYPNYTWFETNRTRSFQNSLSGRLALDYQVSKKTTMGIEYMGALSKPLRKGNNTSHIYNSIKTLDSLVITPSRIEMNRRTHSLNLHSVTKLDSLGKQFSVDVDYFKYISDTNNDFNTNTFLPDNTPVFNRYIAASNISNQNVDIYSAKMDYEFPLQWANLSFGAKVSFINNNSGASYFDTTNMVSVFDPTKSNIFNYKENTQAVYFSGLKNLSEKWDIQLGLRLENTQTKGYSETVNETTKNNYTKLFPTFYLTYKANENSTFGLNYNKRIDRPGYSKLNPFRFYSSSYNYSEGNPFLQPFFTDNIEFSHIYKNFYTAIYGSYLKNGIDEVTYVSNGSISQIVKPNNFYDQKTVGLIESFTFNKLTFWESNNQLNVYYSKTTSEILNTVPNIDNWTMSFNSNNSFNLNKSKTIKVELNFNYQSPSVAGSYKLSSFYYFDTGFKFLFLKNKLQTAVNFMDIFRTNKTTFTQIVSGIKQENYNYSDTQKFRISVVWNFGKAIKTEKKQRSNEEEKTRTT